ncbi:MAG: RNA-binding transcriptional accessory protein [Acholeplasmatales bacterium]|jgi:uncharacterized protein|nr:RNA-binding transcriptional accessory protein [Acholeplasmatales bacterium]
MNESIIKEVVESLGISLKQVKAVLDLLNEGGTIPFIARYRKEVTGGLDEEQIMDIHKVWEYQNTLFDRKEAVIKAIDERGLLTEELKNDILNAKKLVDVEDLYRPYKEKKKTKATDAIAKGLQGLADFILSFPSSSLTEEAKKYINEEKKVLTTSDAIEGAKYIIAEKVSDNPEYNKTIRETTYNEGFITASVKKNAEDPNKVYELYYEYEEAIPNAKPHRILAINRAEDEKVLTVKIDTDTEKNVNYLQKKVILKNNNPEIVNVLKEAIDDSYKRLLFPSVERDIRSELTGKAEEQAIEVFADNLQKLLLQPPLKGNTILGFDPGFRTGCKLAVIGKTGNFIAKDVIYPHEKRLGSTADSELVATSRAKVLNLINKYKVDIIAIGNGTASRESEKFISDLIKNNLLNVKYVIVSEAGASVYSASELAREEFPDFSVEERSAASIARRIQDPLSELVKIDPKSIGVGQYQHDVTPKKLADSLNFVVSSAVNSVGVDVNTASKSLLIYIAGLNKTSADKLINYRNKNGRFNSRKELQNLLSAKAYEQSIGFLRITDGDEFLDMTSIHPESYESAKKIMTQYGITSNLIGRDDIKPLINKIDRKALAKELSIDHYTLELILDAFIKPLRDPRDSFPQPILKSDVLQLKDLTLGMELQGTVRNVVDFGAFVDIGLHEDGLVHISKLSKNFIKHPRDIVHVGDIVTVYVIKIDETRGKVGLSMVKELA